MNVLSLFDGCSTGQVALQRAGIPYRFYMASEINEAAMRVTRHNFPATLMCGDVTKLSASKLPVIPDLVIGGSPCQTFSNAGKRTGFDGTSGLFWEYVRVLKEVRAVNPAVKFLLENVVMKKEWADAITIALGVSPIMIDAALVSAQSRKRLYWTNIPGVTQPADRGILLKDILEPDVFDYNVPVRDKSKTLRVGDGSGLGTKQEWDSPFVHPKYYHTDAAIDYMLRPVADGRTHLDFHHHSDSADDKSACLTANLYKGVPYNVVVIRKNYVQFDISGKGHNSQQDRAYFGDKSPALTVEQAHRTKILVGAASRGREINGKIRQNIETRKDGKGNALTTVGKDSLVAMIQNGECAMRRYTPTECERLQGLPDGYTDVPNVSLTRRYEMLGNGWNADVIAHILSFLK
ncbi:MAG: DNA cytosine methyltransferase [Chitinophagales bacterium]|nr:DNA cytosine methyltransferase [Chitinophagales bacterium]